MMKWRQQAPNDFEFTLKAWQIITHPASSPTYRRLSIPLAAREKKGCGYFRQSDEVWIAWQRTSARRATKCRWASNTSPRRW